MERQTATSGENQRNEQQQRVSAETQRPGSLSRLALLQPSPPALLKIAPGRAQALNSPGRLDKSGWTLAATPTTVLLLALPNRSVPAGAQSRPRGEGALLS